MNALKLLLQKLTPTRQLSLSIAISAVTGIVAFRSSEIDGETLLTFVAFYTILVLMLLIFIYRAKLTNVKTRQLLQLSYTLLGFVLMLTGALGLFNDSISMISVFFLMLFVPGFALMRSGLNFNRIGESS